MMKRTVWIAALLMGLLFLCTACAEPAVAPGTPARAVYYLTEGERGRTLDYEILSLPEGTPEQKIRNVLEAMRHPVNNNHIPLLREEVELKSVEVFGSTVVIRFSSAYDQLKEIERSLLHSGIVLSLQEMEDIGYVRITGSQSGMVGFMNADAVVLEDSDLRLTTFDIEVYPVDRSTGRLVAYPLHIASEREVLTPQMVLEEMMAGSLGEAAPFDGRMDVRNVTSSGEHSLHADLYVPVELDLRGREADLWSVVNSLCSCRGVEEVTVVINGRAPSECGLQNCDGALTYNADFIG